MLNRLNTQDTRGQLGIFAVLIFGVIALVVLTVTLLLGMSVVGSMAADLDDAETLNKTANPDPITGEAVSFENTIGNHTILEVYSVNDSTGNAVALTGAPDSYVQSQDNFTIAEDTDWSVSTWARVNQSSQSETMTAVSANGRVLLKYNGSTSNWTVWYYEEGDRDSWTATVDAPNQPSNFSLVTATSNGTHLTIYRNTTQGTVTEITGSNIADVNTSSTNWHGRLDETRTFDDFTNDSEQSTLHSNPVAPRKDRNRTARIMYDEGSGSTTAIYFTDTSADLSNFSWVSGLNGHTLTEGTDYELDKSAGTITALAGGRIDGAPVVWINYRYFDAGGVADVASAILPAFSLFSSSVIIIPAVAVLAVLLVGLFSALRIAGNVELDNPFGRNNGR